MRKLFLNNKIKEIQRFKEVDLLKGFLILAVVIGHSSSKYAPYIFWFHMPAFFMVSGFLYKVPSVADLKYFSIRKILSLLIPYVIFLLSITVISIALGYLRLDFSFLIKAVLGGKLLVYEFGVFWFITCLLFTILIYTFATINLKDRYLFMSFIVICYAISQFEYYLIHIERMSVYLPFNIDSALMGIVYFHLGNKLRTYYDKFKTIILKNRIIVFLVTMILMIILFSLINGFDFDMKYQNYGGLIYSVFIPTIITCGLFVLAILCNDITYFNVVFITIGKCSLLIMYLHLVIKKIMIESGSYNLELFVIISIVLPIILSKLFERSQITSLLFLGKLKILKM